jgi:hypothetical protein
MPADAAADARIDDLAQLCGSIPATFDEWETCYRRRLCEWALHCDPLGRFSTVQECIQLIDATTGGQFGAEIAERRRAVSDERAFIDVGAFAQCLRETDPSRCKTAKFNVDCANRYGGTVADGAECYADVECASAGFPELVFDRRSGAWCERDCEEACCAGTCRRAGTEGATCSGSSWCEPDLRCSIDARCLSGDLGTYCRQNNDCDRGLWCNQTAPLRAGTCAATLAAGAACSNHFQCPGDTLCIAPTVGAQAHCVRTDRPGDACNGDCFGKMYCELNGTSGQCRALRKVNETCGDVARCDSVATVCLRGLCVRRVGAGQSCATAICLPGLFCSSEIGAPVATCLEPQATDARCTDDAQCASFACGPQNRCLAGSDSCPL